VGGNWGGPTYNIIAAAASGISIRLHFATLATSQFLYVPHHSKDNHGQSANTQEAFKYFGSLPG
jgi:hypothetical protein